VKTDSETHPTSYIMAFTPVVKRLGHKPNHSPLSSANVKIAWRYAFAPPYVFMAWYHVKDRDNFTFYLILLFVGFTVNTSFMSKAFQGKRLNP
jgi:hypothetical protein